MIDLIFPDGSVRQYPQGSSGRDVATAISPSLAKRTLLVRLDGQLLDFDRPLPDSGGKVEFVDRNDPDALDTIRHDTAHVLAEAVQELFPGTQVTIGPNVEDGFYYDVARTEPFSTDDFAAIEKRMAEIVDRDEKIVINTTVAGILTAPIPWGALARNPDYAIGKVEYPLGSNLAFPTSKPHPWRTKRAAAQGAGSRDPYRGGPRRHESATGLG